MKQVERYEDMSPTGRLVVCQQDDGDMIVSIIPDRKESKHFIQSAEFCTLSGGGQSFYTRKSLQNLLGAIEKDNQERPQKRG